MAVNVCPADRVQAPVEVIWELLMDPAGYGGFWDMTVERVEPEGPAAAGQKFTGWTREFCRRWQIEGEVLEVDAERHQIRFRTSTKRSSPDSALRLTSSFPVQLKAQQHPPTQQEHILAGVIHLRFTTSTGSSVTLI